MTYAGFWRRLAAFLIDILPITFVTTLFFFLFLGFDGTLSAFHDLGGARDVSYLVWIVYSAVLESSPQGATYGKRLMGIRVIAESGEQISWVRAGGRNLAKILSMVPLGLGFVWMLFSKDEQAWHDMLARTYVTRT